MSDDPLLGGLGKLKINKKKKVFMLCVGLFFSIYLLINNAEAILASEKKDLPDDQKQSIGRGILASKLDPMEKVKEGVAKVKKAKKDEQKEQLEKIEKQAKEKTPSDGRFEKYRKLVSDHPIEAMLPHISQWDNETASFLIAIAKKESDWGLHSPQKAGKNCFNYWGYRGTHNQTDSGYSCFDSPEQAISVVGERISELIAKKVNTPEKMVVWKCGSSCAGHDPNGVKKWISDVALYYQKLNS